MKELKFELNLKVTKEGIHHDIDIHMKGMDSASEVTAKAVIDEDIAFLVQDMLRRVYPHVKR